MSRSAQAAALAIPSHEDTDGGIHVAVAFVEGFLQSIMRGVRFVTEGLDESCAISAYSVSVLLNGWFRLRRMRPCLR